MVLTNSKKTVNIIMKEWNGSGYGPDWSNDFFGTGVLEKIEDDNYGTAYIVRDVDYCIEQAEDWKNMRGDYAEEREELSDEEISAIIENRLVDVTIIKAAKMYTADRETGTFIDEVFSIEEGKKRIADYEKKDKEDGTYTEDFYDIVDDEHCSILP